MPTERNTNKNKSNSTSPELNDSQQSLLPLNNNNNHSQSGPSTTYPLGISFLSTTTPLNESEDMAYIEKRTAHNALERQRREGLNSKFQELAHVLPSLQQIRRPSKSMIVAKSLEFVSNAVERETDFKGQLKALRLENAQLLRQAKLSQKNTQKQIDNDKLLTTSAKKMGKQSINTITTTKISNNKSASSSSIMKSNKKLFSKMKPQLRHSSMPISSSSSNMTSNSLENPIMIESKKRSRQDDDDEENDQSSPLNKKRESSYTSPPPPATLLPTTTTTTEPSMIHSPPQVVTNNSNKRRRTATDIPIHSNSNTTMPITHIDYHSLLVDQQHRHQRYSSHQSDNNLISPVVSRQNSIDHQLFDNDTTTHTPPAVAVVPSQFDLHTSTSPFGNEHTFYNTFENFEHVVSTIPALRTPIGRNNASTTTTMNQQPPPPYDPTTLDIFNSLMQDPNPVPDDNNNYYWQMNS